MRYKIIDNRVDATQWFEFLYDRVPGIYIDPIYHLDVGFFRDPDNPGYQVCEKCGKTNHEHGWISRIEAKVCPGDYIVTGVFGTIVLNEDAFRGAFKGE